MLPKVQKHLLIQLGWTKIKFSPHYHCCQDPLSFLLSCPEFHSDNKKPFFQENIFAHWNKDTLKAE